MFHHTVEAEKVHITRYHYQGNPVEQFNCMLLILEEKDKHQWRDYVKPLVHAYYYTRNGTTCYSHNELMIGRQSALPVYFSWEPALMQDHKVPILCMLRSHSSSFRTVIH